MSEQSDRPVAKFQAQTISTAVWRNEREEDGNVRTTHAVTLRKSYQDADGNWREMQIRLFPSEIPRTVLVLQEAYAYLTLRRPQEHEPAGV